MLRGIVMVCDVDLARADATRTHTVEVARGFAEENFDVQLVARGPDPGIDGVSFTPGVGSDRQRVRRVASLNLRTIQLLRRQRRTARRFYVRPQWTLMPALFAGRLLRYRVVVQIDDLPFGPSYRGDIPVLHDYFKRAVVIALGRLADGLVAVTAEIKGLLVDEFKVPAAKIAVLPNGVDIDFFRPTAREAAIERVGLDGNNRYVVFCGRLAPWVDFDTLLGAFSLVARQREDARLLLIGDGEARSEVEVLSEQLGLNSAVSITGFVQDRVAVRDYLAAATLTVISHRSSYVDRIGVSPTKLAESLAAGRAVVIKEVRGMRELVESADAGIVVPGDKVAMAQAILSLLDPHEADRLGANGRRLAEERFSWRSVVRGTLPLFEV